MTLPPKFNKKGPFKASTVELSNKAGALDNIDSWVIGYAHLCYSIIYSNRIVHIRLRQHDSTVA